VRFFIVGSETVRGAGAGGGLLDGLRRVAGGFVLHRVPAETPSGAAVLTTIGNASGGGIVGSATRCHPMSYTTRSARWEVFLRVPPTP
jgi:hypothetical protein